MLAGPLVLQNLIHVANVIVLPFWLGRFGNDEVAAVGVIVPVFSIVAAGIVGCQLKVNHAYRASRCECLLHAWHLAFTGLVTAVVAGLVIAGLFALGAEPLMRLLARDPTAAGLAARYLWTMMRFYPLVYAGHTPQERVRRMGRHGRGPRHQRLDRCDQHHPGPVFHLRLGTVPGSRPPRRGAGVRDGNSSGFQPRNCLRNQPPLELLARSVVARVSGRYVRETVDVGAPLSGQRLVSDVVRVAIVGLVVIVGGAAEIAALTVGERVATLAIGPARGLQQAAQRWSARTSARIDPIGHSE